MINKNNLAYLLLFLTTLFWSGNFIVGKAASIYEIPPFSLNFFRWFFACLILMPFTFKELIKKKDYIFANIAFFIILGASLLNNFAIAAPAIYFTPTLDTSFKLVLKVSPSGYSSFVTASIGPPCT